MKSKVIVALDYPDMKSAMTLVEELEPELCRLKVGKELFTRCGPSIVDTLVSKKFDVFLDLKYHDIPSTVANACRAAADLGVWMLNVHSLGGPAMLDAARNALNGSDAPYLIAVTLLTSSGQAELDALGIDQSPLEFVQRLALMTKQAGLDGIVCSAHEAHSLKKTHGSDFKCITPGIRLTSANKDDQQRVMTPVDAVNSGADYLVIGRPVTRSDDPCKVLRTILSDIA